MTNEAVDLQGMRGNIRVFSGVIMEAKNLRTGMGSLGVICQRLFLFHFFFFFSFVITEPVKEKTGGRRGERIEERLEKKKNETMEQRE
jgi:hypothetical protein